MLFNLCNDWQGKIPASFRKFIHRGKLKMSMVKCPECGHDVSDKSDKCLNCGYGVADHFRRIEWEKQNQIAKEDEERRKKEDFDRRMANVKIPKKNTLLWKTVVVFCMFYGALVFFAALIGGYSTFETFGALIMCILIFGVLPISIYRRKCKKYNEIQANIDGYKRKQVEKQIKYEELKERNSQVMQPNVLSAQPNALKCRKCGSRNISVSFQTIGNNSKTTGEVRKKSVATRAGNKVGRAGMIMATGGLWALTPKKSNYKEIQKGKTKTIQVKIAICQDCGKSWRV